MKRFSLILILTAILITVMPTSAHVLDPGESPGMELSSNGSYRVYIHGDGRLLGTADYDGSRSDPVINWFLTDHLGSTVAVKNDTESIWPDNSDHYQQYRPYGKYQQGIEIHKPNTEKNCF